mmetsp:Transcript_67916/g.156190  ORF Transcript_67916/g.156190 Transcript_67916/m.156190 type:complete len:105 (-) Transcript_67916:60-374(-)
MQQMAQKPMQQMAPKPMQQMAQKSMQQMALLPTRAGPAPPRWWEPAEETALREACLDLGTSSWQKIHNRLPNWVSKHRSIPCIREKWRKMKMAGLGPDSPRADA